MLVGSSVTGLVFAESLVGSSVGDLLSEHYFCCFTFAGTVAMHSVCSVHSFVSFDGGLN